MISLLLLSSLLFSLAGALTGCDDQMPPAPIPVSLPQSVVFMEMTASDLSDTTWVTSIRSDGTNRRRLFNGVMTTTPYAGKVIYVTRPDSTRWRVEVGSVNGGMRTIAAEGLFSQSQDDGIDDLDQFMVVLSPTGKKVVFGTRTHKSFGENERYLYSADIDGMNRVRLADNRSARGHVAIAPNGQRVVYYGIDDSQIYDTTERLYIVNINGGRAIPLTDGASGIYDGLAWLEWSPDGNRIAFTGTTDDGLTRQICVVNADGSGRKALTHDSFDNAWPVWSPDGSRIAYIAMTDTTTDIRVMNADGSNRIDLTAGSDDLYSLFPQWSPDGSKILYTAYNGSISEVAGILRVLDIASGRTTTLSTSTFRGFWVK